VMRQRMHALETRAAESPQTVDVWVVEGADEAEAFLAASYEQLNGAIVRQKPADLWRATYVLTKGAMAAFYLTVAPVVLAMGAAVGVPAKILVAPATGVLCGIWALASAFRGRVREQVPFAATMEDLRAACSLETSRLVAFGGTYTPQRSWLTAQGPVTRMLNESDVSMNRAVHADVFLEPADAPEKFRLWIFGHR